jgi:hypothetical protein
VNRPSFSSLIPIWRAYFSVLAASLARDDPRHHLSSEVQARLTQLDIALRYVAEHEARLQPDRARAELAEFAALQAQLQRGELSMDQYWQRLPKSQFDHQEFVDAFSHIRFFAESFYLLAWRLRQLLNSKPPRDFPNLPDLKTPSLLRVRNLLIEHPEQLKADAKYEQDFIHTDDGIVLKTAQVLLQQGGRTAAPMGHTDQGFYLNAAELHQELQSAFSVALSCSTESRRNEA